MAIFIKQDKPLLGEEITSMKTRILIVEDRFLDADFAEREIRHCLPHTRFQRVETEKLS